MKRDSRPFQLAGASMSGEFVIVIIVCRVNFSAAASAREQTPPKSLNTRNRSEEYLTIITGTDNYILGLGVFSS
jgi:hypothetical protein